MPYPTIVTDDAARSDRVNQFRTYTSSLPDPAQPQIDADLKAYQEHVTSLGDVSVPPRSSSSSSPSSAAVSSSAANSSPAPGDVAGWRQVITQQLGQNASPDLVNAVLSGAYAESGLDPTRRQANGNGRGFFQFDTGGGMGTGVSDAQLNDQAYQASKILPRYIDAWNRAPTNLTGADKAAWVAVQAERPDDSRGQASANYRAAYNRVVSNVGQSDQSGPSQAAAGVVSPNGAMGAPSGGLPASPDYSLGTGQESQQPPSPNDDLKAFSAYASSLGDPGELNASSPQAATSPDSTSLMGGSESLGGPAGNSARSPSGSSGLPDFGAIAQGALNSVGGLVSSMLPKPASQDQGFSLTPSTSMVPRGAAPLGTPKSFSMAPEPYNDMAGAGGPASAQASPQQGLIDQALGIVSKAATIPQQAVSAAVMPDLSHPSETPQQRTQRYWNEHTDPKADTITRLGQLLDYATSVEDTQVAATVKQNPNAGFIAPAFKAATNPLSYLGVSKPMLAAGGVGAAGNAGFTALQGGTPGEVGTAAVEGFNTGQFVGGLGEGAYALGKAAAPVVGKLAGAVAPALKRLASDTSGMVGQPGSTRYFHGSGEVFAKPDASKFVQGSHPEADWGPYYFMSRDPEVHTLYAPHPDSLNGQWYQAKTGRAPQANVRAIDVPNDLPLFDFDKNRSLYNNLLGVAGGDRIKVGNTLQKWGYDGIKSDEWNQIAIFPDSMGKLTNAISGTRFGSPPAVGGAIVGGMAGSTQGNTPEERARNALLGAAAGGVGAHLLGSGQMGRLAREESGAINLGGIVSAGKGTAKAINELIAPAKNTPPQVQAALKDFANRNLEGAVQAETIGLRAKKILGALDNSDTAGFFESTSQLHPNQTPEQAAFAREVHDYMETTKQTGLAHGYIQGDVVNGPNAQVSSYFPHIYQENLTKATTQARKGGLNPNDFYSNSRTFPTLSDAQAAGFNPVDSFSGPLQHYVGRVASSEAKYQLVENLKNAGPPAAIPYTAGMKLPDGWVAGSSTVPQFAKYAFPEPVARAINNIVGGSGVRNYGAGRLVLNTQAEAKQLLFTLSGFHNVTELRQAINANGFKGVPIVAKTLENGFIPGAWDKFRLGESDGLALAARSGVTGLAGPGKAIDVGTTSLSPLAATGIRSSAGAVSGAASGYGIGAASGADDQTKIRLALLGAVGGALAGPAMKPIADALWERQVPTLKYLTWKTQVGLGRSPEAAATFVNNTYGGQNLAAIARSKTVQDVTRTVLLAPDWWESWSRQIGNVVAKGDLGKTTREYWARTAIINAFTLEGLNYAFNHHFTNENDPDHANQVEVTGLYKQLGVDRRDPKTGAPIREYMSVLPSPIESLMALASGTTGGATKFASGRLSTGSRVAIQQLSNKDYRGQTIVPPYTPPLEEAKLRGANILGQVSPIGVQQAETSSANAEPASLAAFATATGLRTSRAGQSTYGGPQLSQKSYDILNQSGLSDWRPTPIGNSIGGVGLTRDERTQYQSLVDQAREKILVTMTSRPAWQKMSIAQRRTVLDDVMRSVDEAAGAQVLKGVPRDEAKKRLQLAASAK